MKELVGKFVRGVLVDEEQTMLRFECDGGPVTFRVSGDCCSESWFADLIGYQALVGHTVKGVREVKLEEGKAAPDGVPFSDQLTAGGRTRQDCDRLYGYVIETDGGQCTIAFRNSSNGHYGGECDLFVHEPKATWRPIVDDWSA